MTKSITSFLLVAFSAAVLIHPTFAQEKPSLVEFLSKGESAAAVFSTKQEIVLEAIRSDPAVFDLQIGRARPDSVRDALAFTVVLPTESGRAAKVTATFDGLVVERRTKRNYSLSSRGGKPGSSVSLVVSGVDVLGTIRHEGTIYKVHPLGSGLTAVYRYDTTRLQDHPDNYSDFIKKQSQEYRMPRKPHPPRGLETDEVVIDVLVVYTKRAQTEAGNIDVLIRTAFDETNQIYNNSRVVPRLRLVHSYLANGYREGEDLEVDLNRLRSRNDGYIDEVHMRRDENQADVVVLLVGNGRGCGIGYLYATANTAFSVVRHSCATGIIRLHTKSAITKVPITTQIPTRINTSPLVTVCAMIRVSGGLLCRTIPAKAAQIDFNISQIHTFPTWVDRLAMPHCEITYE